MKDKPTGESGRTVPWAAAVVAVLIQASLARAEAAPACPGAKNLYYRQLQNPKVVSNIGLTYSIELCRQGRIEKVDNRMVFRRGDELRFHVQPNVDGYLYIVLTSGTSGDSSILFPAPGSPEDNRVERGRDYVIPKFGALAFDDTPGRETLKLLLSRTRLEDAAGHHRAIVITSKGKTAPQAKFLIDFARSSHSSSMTSPEKPPSFQDEPAVTMVSTDAVKPLSVELELMHESGALAARDRTPSGADLKDSLPEKPPSFQDEPVATMVSTDAGKPISVELELMQQSGAPLAGDRTQSGPELESFLPDQGMMKITGGESTPSRPVSSASFERETAHSAPSAVARLSGDLAGSVVADKWALVVGISKFSDPRWNLLFPDKDARDFARFLTSECRFAPDHVRVLTNSDATRERILTELGGDWLPKNVGQDDLVVIFIATHGSSEEQDIARKNFLLAHDTNPERLFASGIEMNDLARTIKRRIKARRVVIVLDTCHAGAAESGAKSFPVTQAFDIKDLVQGTGQLVVASSSSKQKAHDSLRYRNGIFTKHFIDGLRQFPRFADAFDYTKERVSHEAGKDFQDAQTPVLKEGDWKGEALKLKAPPVKPRPPKP